jgi:hypothetical protein
MTRKNPNTRLPRTVIPAIALALLIAGGLQAFAQGSSPGTAGGSSPPSANPNQVPSTSPAENRPVTPSGGTVGMGGSRIPGHTGQVSTVEVKPDPVVEQSEKEVSRRIKSICRGC